MRAVQVSDNQGDSMSKKNFGEVTGKCNICGINLWDSCDGKPAIFPCGVAKCPYEDKPQMLQIEFSSTGSGLAQIMEN